MKDKFNYFISSKNEILVTPNKEYYEQSENMDSRCLINWFSSVALSTFGTPKLGDQVSSEMFYSWIT